MYEQIDSGSPFTTVTHSTSETSCKKLRVFVCSTCNAVALGIYVSSLR